MLAIQLLCSFVIGGGFIALLSVLAERADERVSGIIMMFPTTMVLGFFFLALATSPAQVANVVPATLIPLGIVIFSSVIYIYFALFFSRYVHGKMPQIITTFIASAIAWFCLAAPFAVKKFSSVPLGILGYFALITAAHYLLNRRAGDESVARPAYTRVQITFRAVFIGAIIAGVVLMGKLFNPFWGGVFTMFPAATLATLMTFHYYYEPSQLSHFMKKAPLGSLALFIYALSVMVFYPRVGIVPGTLCGYALSLSFSLLMIRMRLKPTGEKKF